MLEVFEASDKKGLHWLNWLLVNIQAMKSVLIRAQKEIKSVEEKASIILKEYSHEQYDGRNMNIADAVHDISEGNEEQIIANWR